MHAKKLITAVAGAAGLTVTLLVVSPANASDTDLYICHAHSAYVREEPVGAISGRVFHSQIFHREAPTSPGGWIKGYAPAVHDGPIEERHGEIHGYIDHDYTCTGPQN